MNALLDGIVEFIMHPLIMMHLGLLANLAKELGRIHRESGQLMSPKDYFVGHPYQTLLTGVACYAGLALSHSAGELGPGMAFAIGYAGDSVAEVLGKRNLSKLEQVS